MRALNFVSWTVFSRRLRSGGRRTKSYFLARRTRCAALVYANSVSRHWAENCAARELHDEARPIMNRFKTRQELVSHKSFLNVHIVGDWRKDEKTTLFRNAVWKGGVLELIPFFNKRIPIFLEETGTGVDFYFSGIEMYIIIIHISPKKRFNHINITKNL